MKNHLWSVYKRSYLMKRALHELMLAVLCSCIILTMSCERNSHKSETDHESINVTEPSDVTNIHDETVNSQIETSYQTDSCDTESESIEPEEILESYLHPGPDSPYSLLSYENITGAEYSDRTLIDAWWNELYESLGEDHAVPPGTQTPRDILAASVVKADRSIVGTVRQIRFSKNEDYIPFAYTYDSKTKEERFAMILYHRDTSYYRYLADIDAPDGIPMLVICKTSFGGLNRLCRTINNGELFNIDILNIANISEREDNLWSNLVNVSGYEDCIIDVNDPPHVECDVTRAVGVVGRNSANTLWSPSDQMMIVYANVTEAMERELHFKINQDYVFDGPYKYMQETIDLYGLGDLMQLEP